MTRIEDTLYNADGTTVEGTATVSWKQFTSVDGSTIANSKINVPIVQGLIAVELSPNEGATPTGSSYRVDYALVDGTQYTETWVVPASSSPLKISTVRVGLPPQPNGTISQSQVEGLVAELDGKADLAESNTFTEPLTLQESVDGQTLLGFEKAGGSDGVYFRLPTLNGSSTYTLPTADGLPNQQLTTDGSGHLFWAAVGAGAGTSAYEVVQNSGITLTQRNVLNFGSGLQSFDEPGSTRTTVQPIFGTTAGTVTQGNDSRLSNARTPLAHKTTHQIGGSDPITPALIGALQRNNDFMLGANATSPVLVLQGASNQSAALQEWRDGSGSLAALVTPAGSAFFREFGLSAKTGSTTTTQFFQIDGLNRFGLSATSTVFDVVRYNDTGLVKDRPFRIFRNGDMEINATLSIGDAAVGAARTTFTGPSISLGATTTPSTPASGSAKLFLDSGTGEISVRKSSGVIISLEATGTGGAGGGGSGGSFGQFVDNEIPSGTINGSNAVFNLAFTPDPAASLNLTRNGIGQQLGIKYNLAGKTITFLAGNIPQTGDVLRASYRTGASQAGGDLSGNYPNPTVSGLQGRLVSSGAALNGECLAWNDFSTMWEPGPCALVTDQLTWTFSGTPGVGAQPLTMSLPPGLTAATLQDVRIVTAATGSTATTFNIERCIANCTTSAAVFSPIYTNNVSLGATLRSDLFGTPDNSVVEGGDQFRVNFVSIGSGVANVTITLIFNHQAYAALETQSPLNCASYCAEIWDAAGLDPFPFGPPRRVGDACVCFGAEMPERVG
ncbi:MAG: hypothetical protein GC160_04140 [Acidobacteria bacterium]|nr:hypothetical protein [Acidobacteriota bacterium]